VESASSLLQMEALLLLKNHSGLYDDRENEMERKRFKNRIVE